MLWLANVHNPMLHYKVQQELQLHVIHENKVSTLMQSHVDHDYRLILTISDFQNRYIPGILDQIEGLCQL